jgi:hypothetical protein
LFRSRANHHGIDCDVDAALSSKLKGLQHVSCRQRTILAKAPGSSGTANNKLTSLCCECGDDVDIINDDDVEMLRRCRSS